MMLEPVRVYIEFRFNFLPAWPVLFVAKFLAVTMHVVFWWLLVHAWGGTSK